MKFIRSQIRHVLFENTFEKENFYHGIRGLFPFTEFDNAMQGTGVVSGGRNKKYGGFFFTSSKENAEYYGEHWVCKVAIDGIVLAPENLKHPPSVMPLAYEKKTPMKIEDILDGSKFSDIVVVPENELSTITILEWLFVGDKEFYFELLDEFFGFDENDEESYISTDMIDSVISFSGGELDYLLRQNVFKEYYERIQTWEYK